jgi:hypothetical protein
MVSHVLLYPNSVARLRSTFLICRNASSYGMFGRGAKILTACCNTWSQFLQPTLSSTVMLVCSRTCSVRDQVATLPPSESIIAGVPEMFTRTVRVMALGVFVGVGASAPVCATADTFFAKLMIKKRETSQCARDENIYIRRGRIVSHGKRVMSTGLGGTSGLAADSAIVVLFARIQGTVLVDTGNSVLRSMRKEVITVIFRHMKCAHM